MRGKGDYAVYCDTDSRITPAYAGKSPMCHQYLQARKDHPRLCGEKSSQWVLIMITWESPPPMRGKEQGIDSGEVGFGMTPAYAGKRFRC